MSLKEYLKLNPESPIAEAARLSEKSHQGQKRLTGEPYFTHPMAVAEILHNWKLDETTIVAGLLHDTVEDTSVTLDEIGKKFGKSAAFLVNGMTKLSRIKYRGSEEDQAENLRKMILALSEDLRVVFIKLADRLHNMRTLSALPPMKQKRIALETDEIYAPLAYRLGMQQVSGELQDLAFPYIYPREYEWLKEKVSDAYEARTKYASRISPLLQKELESHGLRNTKIELRAKRWSSLYKKLLAHNMDLDKIYDLVAVRILTDSVEECYAALGLTHSLWIPLPGRMKDYIAMPKPNGYKSLHTTVIGPDKKILEVQIRTKEMHEESENGIAAHWLYKEKRAAKKDELKWVSQLRAWQEFSGNDMEAEEFIESLKTDFFKHRIFAITPKGEVIDLPAGATPVDFAYHVHTEIGNSCVGAKINGEIAPLGHELKSGDMVEILTQKNKKPSEDWLKFIKSSVARDHIKANLRKKSKVLKRGRV
jgi:GTP pyrophosphokinase